MDGRAVPLGYQAIERNLLPVAEKAGRVCIDAAANPARTSADLITLEAEATAAERLPLHRRFEVPRNPAELRHSSGAGRPEAKISVCI